MSYSASKLQKRYQCIVLAADHIILTFTYSVFLLLLRIKPYDALQHLFFRRESTTSTSSHSTSSAITHPHPHSRSHDVALPPEADRTGLARKSSQGYHSGTSEGMMMSQDSQYHAQYSTDVFPSHSHLQHKPSFTEFGPGPIQHQTSIPDPTHGRTNIPMALPPGSVTHSSYSGLEGSSVTLTPLSPPQPIPEALVPGIEVPYPHHPSFTRPYNPQDMAMSADSAMGSGKGYVHFPVQNGSVPQAFFGTNRLFPESEPFHFKFGVPNLGPVGANLHPFHFQQNMAAANGLEPARTHKTERTRHTLPRSSNNHSRHEPPHDDSPMMGVVVQR